MNFGEYLKGLRKATGLSKRQLAHVSNISNDEIYQLESGEIKKPSPTILKALAPHLAISYTELMNKAGYLDENIDVEYIFNDKLEDKDLIKLVKSIEGRDAELLLILSQACKELPNKDIKKIKDLIILYLHYNKEKFKC